VITHRSNGNPVAARAVAFCENDIRSGLDCEAIILVVNFGASDSDAIRGTNAETVGVVAAIDDRAFGVINEDVSNSRSSLYCMEKTNTGAFLMFRPVIDDDSKLCALKNVGLALPPLSPSPSHQRAPSQSNKLPGSPLILSPVPEKLISGPTHSAYPKVVVPTKMTSVLSLRDVISRVVPAGTWMFDRVIVSQPILLAMAVAASVKVQGS